MQKFLWFLTGAGSVIGFLILVIGTISANGAPQECAAASIAVACGVLPYCLARANFEFK
jgi:hypothetical protein